MRADMGRMAFDAGSHHDAGIKGNSKCYGRDMQEWPDKEGMRKRRGYKQPRDYLAPAFRWLVSRANRPWDAVWSELCAVNDSRTLSGYHLRQHIRSAVRLPSDPETTLTRIFGNPTFFVDDKGYLRHRRIPRKRYV